MLSNITNVVGVMDAISNQSCLYQCNSFYLTGDMSGSTYHINGGYNGTVNGELSCALSCLVSCYSIKVVGVVFSNTRGGSAGSNYVYEADFIGNLNNTDYSTARVQGNIVGGVFQQSDRSKSGYCVLEDSTISGGNRFPLRVYTNAGNVLPLDSGDTDWQVPESGNSWIMQEIPNSYCTYNTFVNQVAYSPINPMAIVTQAQQTTLTFKIWPVGWTTSLDQDDVVLEVQYLNTASGITRTTAYNTSQTYANGAWRSCSVTFTPSQAGIVYFQLYFRSYQSGCYVLIDPIWSVS